MPAWNNTYGPTALSPARLSSKKGFFVAAPSELPPCSHVFPWVLYFHFYVHWGAYPVGATLSTNFVFSVSAPPIRSPSQIVSSLTLSCSGLSWLRRWWVVAQLSLLLVVFGGGGF